MSEAARTILALRQLPGIGRAKVMQVLDRAKSTGIQIPSIEEAVEWVNLAPYGRGTIDAAILAADQILEQCDALAITIRIYGLPSYPGLLQRLRQPPAVLFASGPFEPELKPRIAVIGTRTPTAWGNKTARACAHQILTSSGVIVSGLAVGVDTAAHRSAIDHGGTTWAVLPHGINAAPATPRQRILAQQVVESGGALISEYWPNEPAQRRYFVERDRIQAGLSDAVLLIESELDGGAMHTVRFARQAQVSVWVTFPNAKSDLPSPRTLPPVQRGPWKLLHEQSAIRVASVMALESLIRDLSIATLR